MGSFATHRFLTRIALAAAHVFAWLFIFQYFSVRSGDVVYSLVATTLTYALAQTVAILATPYTARRLRHGVRGMLVNALLSLSAAFAVLACAFSGLLGSLPFGITLFAMCMGLYRALYWIPYELAAHKQTLSRTGEYVIAIVPAVSGYAMTLTASAPLMVLAVASFVSLAAIIPLYATKNTHEGFSWGYRETFAHLFTARHRRPLVQAICTGFEGAVLLLLWPIAILVLLGWSYFALGLVLSATYALTIVVRMFIGRVDHVVQAPVMLSLLTASGWILRGTVAAPFTIVLVDTYYHSMSGVSQRGVDMPTTEQSADSNTYIDEFTALKDMGQGIGRLLFCVTLGILALFFTYASLTLVMFGIAALVGVLSIHIARTATKHAF